ncbi:MAG: penicillin acylase family protein, partial [Nitrosomonas sp.]|nr:penicillin acylase family protein [Nitrosomonas sp.]
MGVSTVYISLYLSLRDKDSEGFVAGLTDSVVVALDQFGVPTIATGSRLDGYRALGYMTARDRMFQMDLLRRRGSGRLAEIFGEFMISADTEQRVLGFESVAREVVGRLPINQREVLEAYAEGVNSVIDGMIVAPFEFLLLGYRPERWRIEDSLLVVLSMFQEQSNSEEEERMLSVMEQGLPVEVYK